jgi:beta-fructofuranosidase
MDTVSVSTSGLNAGAEVSVGVWELKSAWAEEENGKGVVVGNSTEVRRDERWEEFKA